LKVIPGGYALKLEVALMIYKWPERCAQQSVLEKIRADIFSIDALPPKKAAPR
jgi:hypothetical protein